MSISQPLSVPGRAASQLAVMRESHLSPIKGQTPLPASPAKPVLLGIQRKKAAQVFCKPKGFNSCTSFPPPTPQIARKSEEHQGGTGVGRPVGNPTTLLHLSERRQAQTFPIFPPKSAAAEAGGQPSRSPRHAWRQGTAELDGDFLVRPRDGARSALHPQRCAERRGEPGREGWHGGNGRK